MRTSRQLLSSDRDNSNTILFIHVEKNASSSCYDWVGVEPGCNNVTRDLPAGHVVTKQPWKDADVGIHQIKQWLLVQFEKKTFVYGSTSPHEELYIPNCTLSDILKLCWLRAGRVWVYHPRAVQIRARTRRVARIVSWKLKKQDGWDFNQRARIRWPKTPKHGEFWVQYRRWEWPILWHKGGVFWVVQWQWTDENRAWGKNLESGKTVGGGKAWVAEEA